jgi:uncharacterized membrane protein
VFSSTLPLFNTTLLGENVMIQQSDVQGRLRLFRYGLIVITVITFILSWLAPWASFRNLGLPADSMPGITEFLGFALITTVIVAVVMVIAYFAYAQALQRMSGEAASE